MDPPIQKLPLEMLGEVCSYLTQQDILNLRLAYSGTRIPGTLFATIEHKFYPILYMNEKQHGDIQKQASLVAALRGCRTIADRVLRVVKLFQPEQTSLAEKVTLCKEQEEEQKLFVQILEPLRNIQVLTIDKLNITTPGSWLWDHEISVKPTLISITLQHCSLSSAMLKSLFNIAPNLTQLCISESVCIDGWTRGLAALLTCSSLSDLTLQSLFDDKTWGNDKFSRFFAMCGEGDELFRNYVDGVERLCPDLSVFKRCKKRVRSFKVEGKWQQYSLHTANVSFFKGNVAVKEGIKDVLGHYEEQQEE